MVRGELLVANHVTEPAAGSDAGALAMRADRTPDGYRLTGVKVQAAFAVDAEAAIVYARTGPPARRELGCRRSSFHRIRRRSNVPSRST